MSTMGRTRFLIRLAMSVYVASSWTAAHAQGTAREPPFKWEATFASPNTTLTLNETERPPKAAVQQAILYRVQSTGFLSGESVSLWVRRGTRYFELPATVDDQGTVQLKAGNDTLGGLLVMAYLRDRGFAVFVPRDGGTKRLLLAGFAEGHPLDVALVSEGAGRRAQAKVVPIPLRAEGPGGCSASAELQSETGLLFVINLSGFLPGEAVQTQSQYRKEIASMTKTASEDGELSIPVLFGRGDDGTASLTATADRCTVKLEYKVGQDALVR